LKEPETRSFIVNTASVRRCGEIAMSNGVCNLLSLNLIQFIKENDGNYEFDFETFKKAVRVAIRFSDNINDISRTPLPEYSKSVNEKRRIGIGVLALGSLHYVLGIRFGSDESLALIKEIFKTKCEAELLASAYLGKEKGSFTLFDKEKFFNTHWWNTLPISDSVKREVESIGEMRNSHRSANAPTGNMSIYVGMVSGGIEPIFMKDYVRWSIVPESDRAALRESGFQFPDIFEGGWFETDTMKLSKAGTDDILLGSFEGTDYQVDKNRGLTKKTIVKDWGWAFAQENFSEEKIKEFEERGVFATTTDLTTQEHLNTLKVIAPFVDQNSSKTVNLPNDISYEDFKEVYMDAWKSGIKGITTYRAGTMTAVLESVDKKTDSVGIVETAAPKRPIELPCRIHHTKILGKDWLVLVGLLNDDPYEVFAGPYKNIGIPKNCVEGKIIKQKRGVYSLVVKDSAGTETKYKNILDHLDDNDSAWATRLVSMSLRHGVPLRFVCEQLSKDGFVIDTNKVLARILKKYLSKTDRQHSCPSCNSKNVVLQETCITCMDCGFGKCG
jgi:ribonucleoside-diphosphate reductase alpha chain